MSRFSIILSVGYFLVTLSSAFIIHRQNTPGPPLQMTAAPRVAVIGGGAAGLAAARVLTRDLASCQVTVLEQRESLGGVWKYDNSSTHPMYKNLRTNLPKEIMQFREYTWDEVDYDPGQPKSSFLTHRQVLQYLQKYAQQFRLEPLLQLNAKVQHLTVLEGTESCFQPKDEVWPKIRLQWMEGCEQLKSEIFDAVCICNGHYNKPATPNIPGLAEHFKGEVLHSVSYDEPSRFAGKTVLCIGGRASGSDIARELVAYGDAKHVFLSDSVCTKAEETPFHVTWVPKTSQFLPGGKVRFGDDCALEPSVDTVIFCTGYDYEFPFIQNDTLASSLVQSSLRRVQPLYHQLWHAKYPNIALVGLPHSVVPFPLFELQMEAFCNQLVNWKLDGLLERLEAAQKDALSGGVCRRRVPEDTHFLGDAQWDYCRQLAQLANLVPHSDDDTNNSFLNYIATNKAIYDHAGKARKGDVPGSPDDYRSLCYARHDSERTFTAWHCETNKALVET